MPGWLLPFFAFVFPAVFAMVIVLSTVESLVSLVIAV
jgi:hypothetical protein